MLRSSAKTFSTSGRLVDYYCNLQYCPLRAAAAAAVGCDRLFRFSQLKPRLRPARQCRRVPIGSTKTVIECGMNDTTLLVGFNDIAVNPAKRPTDDNNYVIVTSHDHTSAAAGDARVAGGGAHSGSYDRTICRSSDRRRRT